MKTIDIALAAPVVVGVSLGGNDYLFAEQDDVSTKNRRGGGQVYYGLSGQWSDAAPLQSWFKWRVWNAPTDADRDRVADILSLEGSAEKALIAAMVGKAWDESQHPRHAAGDERGGEFAPKEGGSGKVKSLVYDSIKKAKPGISNDALQMYLDAMSLDRERFMTYAKRINMEDAETVADAFFKEQKEISRSEAADRWTYQMDNTLKDDRGGTFHHSEPLDWIQKAARKKRSESTIEEMSSLFSDKFDITVSVDDDFGGDAFGGVSRLANLVEVMPSLEKVMDDKVEGIRFLSESSGTAIAAWNPVTKTIDVYKGNNIGASSWIHELGHAAETYLPDGVITQEFDKGPRVSGYAWGNYSEDFAETFAMIAGGRHDQVAEFVPEKIEVFSEYLPWLLPEEL